MAEDEENKVDSMYVEIRLMGRSEKGRDSTIDTFVVESDEDWNDYKKLPNFSALLKDLATSDIDALREQIKVAEERVKKLGL